MFEENFNGPTSVFVASFVPQLFTCLLGNFQCKQTIVSHTTYANQIPAALIFTLLLFIAAMKILEPVRIPNKRNYKLVYIIVWAGMKFEINFTSCSENSNFAIITTSGFYPIISLMPVLSLINTTASFVKVKISDF